MSQARCRRRTSAERRPSETTAEEADARWWALPAAKDRPAAARGLAPAFTGYPRHRSCRERSSASQSAHPRPTVRSGASGSPGRPTTCTSARAFLPPGSKAERARVGRHQVRGHRPPSPVRQRARYPRSAGDRAVAGVRKVQPGVFRIVTIVRRGPQRAAAQRDDALSTATGWAAENVHAPCRAWRDRVDDVGERHRCRWDQSISPAGKPRGWSAPNARCPMHCCRISSARGAFASTIKTARA